MPAVFRKSKPASVAGVGGERAVGGVGEAGFCRQCKDLGFYTDS